MTTTTAPALPADVKATDEKYPGFENYVGEFELWFAGEWFVPTLEISGGRNAAKYGRRTYAIGVAKGNIVTIGGGPHVTARRRFYVSKARAKALQRYLDLKERGLADASKIRDRVGSRRAEGQLRRAIGQTSWTWTAR